MTERMTRAITGVRAAALCLVLTIATTAPLLADSANDPGRVAFERSSIYVPVRDGTRLAVDIYKPSPSVAGQRLPVVLTMTPYHRATLGPDGNIVPDDTTLHLLERGYAVAIGDVRGKGASFGTRGVAGGKLETQDVGDVITYLGEQPWTNGNVGMHGCSYVGQTVMSGVLSQAPHLKAAVVNSTQFDLMNVFTNGGANRARPLPDERAGPDREIARAVPVDEDTDRTMLLSTREERAKNLSHTEIMQTTPFRDSVTPLTGEKYWQETSFYAHRSDIEENRVPIFFVSSWFDPFVNDTLFAFWTLANATQLHMGHGRHCQSPNFDLNDAMADFFDRYLKNATNPEPGRSVTYYLRNGKPGHEWVTASQFPPAAVAMERFELSGDADSGGMLQREPATTPGSITSPSAPGMEPLVNMGAVRANVDPISATFTTRPFPGKVLLAGIPAVHLSVSAPAEDYVVEAYLEVANPYRYADVVSRGMLLASRRKLGEAPYNNGGLPFPTFLAADVQTTSPGEIVQLSFGLTGIAQVIHPGDQIRLAVTTRPNEDNVRVPVTVHFGPDSASWIELPLAPYPD